ncbi:MAG: hypothetical protein GXO39_04345 [Thermotogae bacterium]|nr:hypothetical protein [Thermotogota bacterium]
MKRCRLPGEADGLAGVAFKIWKQRFGYLWDTVKRRGLVEDWRQEAYAMAIELYHAGWRYGDRYLPHEIYNCWYCFLVRHGFRKRKRDGVVEERYMKIGEFGEEFFAKVEGLHTEPDKKQKKEEERMEKKLLKWKNGSGKEYIFTSHFLKRWKERVGLKFSPKAVHQQLTYGGKIKIQKFGPNWMRAKVYCPWFTLVVVEYKDKRVLLTVF